MAHTLTVKGFGVVVHPEGDLVNVEVEINDGERCVLRNYGFPLGTPKEEIEADLKNVVAGLDSDANHQALIVEQEAKLRAVDAMREEMEGMEISANVSEKDEE